MRKVNIRQLRNNLASELNDLPFIITRREDVIAQVIECTQRQLEKERVHKKEEELKMPDTWNVKFGKKRK